MEKKLILRLFFAIGKIILFNNAGYEANRRSLKNINDLAKKILNK